MYKRQNLLRSKLYVCPLCGNVLHATGQAVVSCCGITLPPLDISEADDADEHHQLTLERVEEDVYKRQGQDRPEAPE